MGWKKFVKKTIKRATRPVTKVFKGVAKGIAKVGKAVIRGVSKLSKKLGPLGMIALSIAMPYALSGLSNVIGYGGMTSGYGASGMLGSSNAFLRAVGSVGNQIRNGYRIGSGAIGKGVSAITNKIGTIGNTITNTITKTFQKFGGNASGDNFWTRISKGARNLFNSAKSVVTGQPTSGSVDVYGLRGNVHGEGLIKTSMKSENAMALLDKGVIEGSQLSGQSFYGSSADKLVTETINKAAEDTIKQLSPDAYKYYNDVNNAYKANGTYINNQQALDTVLESPGTTKILRVDSGSVYNSDLSMTGDYKYHEATMRANPHLESGQSIQDARYTFTGDKTFDNPVAKKFKYKDVINKAKKGSVKWVKDSLLKPVDWTQPKEYEFKPTTAAEFAGSTGAVLSATDIKGATGSSSYASVFGTAAWEKLKAYHKHMNYQGSQESTYT